MQEEKELSLEEMKSLVSLGTILPVLLNKIENINNNIELLKKHFSLLEEKFNDNIKSIAEYKESVDEAYNSAKLVKELDVMTDNMTASLKKLEMLTIQSEDSKVNEDEKNKKAEQEKIKKIAMSIYNNRPKDKPIVNKKAVMSNLKLSEKEYESVLCYLEDKKLYDRKTNCFKNKK